MPGDPVSTAQMTAQHRCDPRARRNYEALRQDGWATWPAFCEQTNALFDITVSHGAPPRPNGRHRDDAAEIKARLSIVDVAERLTELRPTGSNFKGRCPLHSERTGSFYVYVDSGRWQCFGACATGGDVISLIHEAMQRGVWR